MNQLAKKPFALLGVHGLDYAPKKLKEVMEKEKLNWRSFADKGGIINSKWSSPGTPTYYVLDHKGVIRYKWVGNPGAKAFDTALEKLIRVAETGAAKKPE